MNAKILFGARTVGFCLKNGVFGTPMQIRELLAM